MSQPARPSRRDLIVAAPLAVAATPALAAEVLPAGALKGRSVLITGASSGFGRLTALHLAGLGAHVIASMRNLKGGRRPEAASLKAEAASLPGRLCPFIDAPESDEHRVLTAWFFQGHLEESRS
jgi:NADPH:quinone reductase-like Zn-dependent oxidoreductase